MYKIDVEIINTYEANFGTIEEIFSIGISGELFNNFFLLQIGNTGGTEIKRIG